MRATVWSWTNRHSKTPAVQKSTGEAMGLSGFCFLEVALAACDSRPSPFLPSGHRQRGRPERAEAEPGRRDPVFPSGAAPASSTDRELKPGSRRRLEEQFQPTHPKIGSSGRTRRGNRPGSAMPRPAARSLRLRVPFQPPPGTHLRKIAHCRAPANVTSRL
jgi:hypothetical protein